MFALIQILVSFLVKNIILQYTSRLTRSYRSNILHTKFKNHNILDFLKSSNNYLREIIFQKVQST